jgi:hypothetical protein
MLFGNIVSLLFFVNVIIVITVLYDEEKAPGDFVAPLCLCGGVDVFKKAGMRKEGGQRHTAVKR